MRTERRFQKASLAIQTRDAGEEPGAKVVGRAFLYNRMSRNLGGFVERIAPGAAAKTLGDGARVLALWNHDRSLLLGTTTAGTLRLEDDAEGLAYEADLPPTSYARDLASLLARGDVEHSSFAFEALDDEWDTTPEGFPLRTITAMRLVDVSPVTDPAYLSSSSGLSDDARELALSGLAEQRGVPLGKVIDLSRKNELSEVLADRDEARTVDGDSTDRSADSDEGQGETHPPEWLRKARANLALRERGIHG